MSLSVTTRDISILADKELEYARQSLFKTKEIKGLRERCVVIVLLLCCYCAVIGVLQSITITIYIYTQGGAFRKSPSC